MRPIKFRGRDTAGNWHYGFVTVLSADGLVYKRGAYISDSVGMPFAHSVDSETVTQWTGLKDKDGREIYEGDIVEIGNMAWEIAWYIWNAQFVPVTVEPITTTDHISSPGSPMRDFNWLDCGEAIYLRELEKSAPVEVIGNRFENPELLEGRS